MADDIDEIDGPARAGGDSITSEDLAYRATWYYYHDELTQSEIADLLRVSRATVGRLLERARRDGLVQISLSPKLHEAFERGAALATRFGLRDAMVVPDSFMNGLEARDRLTQRLAVAGGRYLASRLRPGDLLAVGWGNTISRALLAIPESTLENVRIVTLTGGVDAYLRAQYQDADPAPGRRRITDLIPAPLLASSPTLARALMEESSVRTPMNEALTADHSVVGIGAVPDNPTLIGLGYQTRDEMEEHARAGIVGDILGRFFTADGVVADLPVHHRVIGTDLAQLTSMSDVVAIAGGRQKVPAILGALRGGYADALVTDEATAAALLAL